MQVNLAPPTEQSNTVLPINFDNLLATDDKANIESPNTIIPFSESTDSFLYTFTVVLYQMKFQLAFLSTPLQIYEIQIVLYYLHHHH